MQRLGLRGRRFSELNQNKVGLVAVTILVLLIAISLNIGAIKRAFMDASYSADFAAGSGLASGDIVEVSGLKVGTVNRIELAGTHVRVYFQISGVQLGDQSLAAIKTLNAVGTRFLAVTPKGTGRTTNIPLSRTSVPYDLESALSDLTRTSEQLNVNQLAASLNSVSGALAGTPTELRNAVSGVARLSQSVASRNDALGALLTKAQSVSGVLSQRSNQIVELMSNGTILLRELNTRYQTIRALLGDAVAVSNQLHGVIQDNDAQLGIALNQVDALVHLLQGQEKSLGYILDHVSGFTRNLGEAVGGGPFFYGYVQNLVPTQILPVLPGLVGSHSGGY